MTKANIKIVEYEDKSTNGFDRTRFKCLMLDGSMKWMSSFRTNDTEKALVQTLKDNANKVICVDITQKTNSQDIDKPYFNITGFHSVVTESNEGFSVPVVAQSNTVAPVRKSVKGSAYEKDPVGLCVEVFSAMQRADAHVSFKQDMTNAIALVKQAQEAF